MSKRKHLRIAATSDLHGFLDGLSDELAKIKPDILIIAGDIQPALLSVNKEEWFKETFPRFVDSLTCDVLLTPGNHDSWIYAHAGYIRSHYPANFHLLVDDEIELFGLKIYGTPWVPWINGRWSWEASEGALDCYYAKIPSGLDIIISHSPPLLPHRKIDVSCDYDKRYQEHFGSTALLKTLKRIMPRYFFCGHIHSGDHRRCNFEHDGKMCSLYNVSRVNERYYVHYPVTKVKISSAETQS